MKATRFCLLIDDDSDDREIFMSAVFDVNAMARCQVVADAEAALQILKGDSPLPDFIFLDINMPKMNGFEFIVHLKRDSRLAQIPVFFYTTTKDEAQISKATTLGASGFITKPATYESLCKILRHFFVDNAASSGRPGD